VTRSHGPLESALDVLVYVPVGLLVTAAEELPKLAAKGRARVGGQVGMAKVVGQFAVAQGRKELSKRLSAAASRDRDEWEDGSWERLSGDWPESGSAGAEPLPEDDGFDPGPDGYADLVAGPAPEPSALAIPGYDSLAASQVVPRLAGLSADELAAVGAYERAHRARRTILTRVRQLQAR
jgi:hypothetical protein